jgi:MOSC domain-containing protein YiiM
MKRSGLVVGVCISPKRPDPKKNVRKATLKEGFGLVGDSHAGTEKEVSLLAIESVRQLMNNKGISAGPGCFAENITTEGIELTSLAIGSQLEVGEARLRVIQIGKHPTQSHTYTYLGYSILPREGIFCAVIKGGEVKIGDPIRLIEHGERTA